MFLCGGERGWRGGRGGGGGLERGLFLGVSEWRGGEGV